MSFSKLPGEPEDLILVDNIINDFSGLPISYKFEVNLSPELVPTLASGEKKELFERMFKVMKEHIGSIQNGNIPLDITELSVLKDLINDNPISAKKLFFYFTDKSRIDYIITAENLATLRDLFPGNASIQKASLTEIKESLSADKQLYSRASVRGLFATKKELPYELAEKIGSHLYIKTANTVAQTCPNAAKQVKEKLDAVEDNALFKRFI